MSLVHLIFIIPFDYLDFFGEYCRLLYAIYIIIDLYYKIINK